MIPPAMRSFYRTNVMLLRSARRKIELPNERSVSARNVI